MEPGAVVQKSMDVILISSFVLIYGESPETAGLIEMWSH